MTNIFEADNTVTVQLMLYAMLTKKFGTTQEMLIILKYICYLFNLKNIC